MRTSTPISGTLVQSLLTLLIYGPIALATTSLEEIDSRGLLVLFAAGIASPGLASTLYYMSFRRIGLSRSSIITSSSPLITVIVAVAALGEKPTFLVYFGTLLIVAGVVSLARERQTASGEGVQEKSVWYYCIFVVLATLMFGAAAVLRKAGLPMIPNLSVAMCMASEVIA